jgi:hypothetical protein
MFTQRSPLQDWIIACDPNTRLYENFFLREINISSSIDYHHYKHGTTGGSSAQLEVEPPWPGIKNR